MPFEFRRLLLPDVFLIECRSFKDPRGYFSERYKRSTFAAHGIGETFVQDNASRSGRNVLRGLHYQASPKAQGKLVMVTRGCIFDVAVDLRRSSPEYGKWVGEELSDANQRMLYVPRGFAHGFCVMSDLADVTYKVTEEYDASLDRGIRWDDPALSVDWPVSDPVVSAKDAALPRLAEAEVGS